jgi:predicted aldo/keto reductase-like oxidoreductase
MKTRILGRTGVPVSTISMGTEYLINKPQAHVDAVIHTAIERGINYFDVFYGQGFVREIYGHAFAGYRDRVMLTAHLGAVEQNGDSARSRDTRLSAHFFEEYLRHFDTDYVDVLFLHNSDGQEDYDTVMAPGGLADVAQRLRDQGKARFIGFSGHTVSTAKQAAESGIVDVIMFPVNLVANAVPGKRELLQTCASNNVALVAMKPYAGGKLLQPEMQVSLEMWHMGGEGKELRKERPINPVQCLHYVLSQVGVSTTVPGFQTIEQLEQGLAYYDATDEERDFAGLLAAFAEYQSGECVYCNHCLPCPQSINVGHVNRLLDMGSYSMTDELRAAYSALEVNASDCIQCGTCEANCPFGVAVIGRMERAADLFA